MSAPTPVSPPTPAPPDEGVPLGPSDAATTALSDALDQMWETAAREYASPVDISFGVDTPGTGQGGWVSGSQDPTDPYSGLYAANGGLASFVGRDVDYFSAEPDQRNTNFYTGGTSVEPVSGFDSSRTIASNGPPLGSGLSSAPIPTDAKGVLLVDSSSLAGQTQIDVVNGWGHYQVIFNGVTYDAYVHDGALPGQAVLVPQSSPATLMVQSTHGPAPAQPSPTASTPPAPPFPPAPTPGVMPPPSSPAASGAEPSWGLGDVLATITGLFAPSAVGPYLHPQTPTNLPVGLQQMGQGNGDMAQHSLQLTGELTRRTMLAAGAPYVVWWAASSLSD